MENEYGMIGALVGVTIIVVGFILVVFLGERQEREKEKLAKIKLDEFYQKEINEIKKKKVYMILKYLIMQSAILKKIRQSLLKKST